ncbi:hypothetical protein Vafri_14053 [Volvox africanus]|uniref:Uncharacterized protein n=1 Tax=Volvox africanus TaxID=51714 RepID=A0A8J4F685_9CHLO|nr:hypothetical protein Vafri_14053 [Volvox africanus]
MKMLSCTTMRPTRQCKPGTVSAGGVASKRAVVRLVRAQASDSAEASPTPAADICSTCGVDRSKMPGGCDGQGRVIGGMGALPGFGWWPIKAYKPCPALYEAGLEYTRKGQMTNDVLFGGVSLGPQGAQSLEEIKKTADKGIRIK